MSYPGAVLCSNHYSLEKKKKGSRYAAEVVVQYQAWQEYIRTKTEKDELDEEFLPGKNIYLTHRSIYYCYSYSLFTASIHVTYNSSH